jgi:nickel/cobalt exporter
MYSIIIGTIILGLVHGLIPNHWLPLVVIAKAESWKKSEVLLVATLTASAHVVGTVILGITLGLVGSKIAHKYDDYVHVITPVLLIIFGLIYFTINLPHQHKTVKEEVEINGRARTKWIIGFVIIMFLSPCLEVESLFLAAGAYGFDNLLLLALIYAMISITGIVTLVMLVSRGVHLINSDFIEHNEKRITGIVLIFVGIVTFYFH